MLQLPWHPPYCETVAKLLVAWPHEWALMDRYSLKEFRIGPARRHAMSPSPGRDAAQKHHLFAVWHWGSVDCCFWPQNTVQQRTLQPTGCLSCDSEAITIAAIVHRESAANDAGREGSGIVREDIFNWLPPRRDLKPQPHLVAGSAAGGI